MMWSPSWCRLRLKHSNVAAAPASSGAPLMPGRCSRPAQRSMPRVAKRWARAFWSAASTWMAECEPLAKTGMVLAPCARLHSTSGGSSDTELKELAVSPTNLPAELRAVTMVTPVANMPRASRNSRGEKLGGGARAGWEQERFTKTAATVVRWRAAKQVGGQAGMPPLSAPARPSAGAGLPRPRPRAGGGASLCGVRAAGPLGGRAGGRGGVGGGGGGGVLVGGGGGGGRRAAAFRQRRPRRGRLRQVVAPEAPKG